MKQFLTQILNAFFRLFPIQSNKILFTSTNYEADGNPLSLYQYIKKNHPQFRCIFLLKKHADLSNVSPEDVAYVHTLSGLYHFATHKYRFTSQSLGFILNKRPEQRYIQLWHGISALKKMGLDAPNAPRGVSQLAHTLDWDYYITSSEKDAAILKSSSGYTCRTMILGAARTDDLYRKDDLDAIRAKLNLPAGRKVLLYAPTFRDADRSRDRIPLPFHAEQLKDYIVLLRLHPFVAEKTDPLSFGKTVRNVSNYPSLCDLLRIADVLVTDYSSIFYDYSILQKPTVFYPYDYDAYIAERGGFYVDYLRDLPGPLARTEEELFSILDTLDAHTENFREKILETNRIYNAPNDGSVCQRISQVLLAGGFDQ